MSEIYWKAEQRCRKHAKIMACYPLLQQIMYVSALYVSISSIIAGVYDTSAWSLPFQMCVPFNTEKFSGWYLLWFIQLNESLTYAYCMIATTLYFVCCCFYIGALCDHLDYLFREIKNEMDVCQNEKDPIKYRQLFNGIREKLFQSIAFHVEILE